MRHRTKWGKKRNEGLSIGNVSDKDEGALNVTKTFINGKRVDSVKFENEAHFMSFAAIIYIRMGQRAQIFISETQ